jgi:hypothetical protein
MRLVRKPMPLGGKPRAKSSGNALQTPIRPNTTNARLRRHTHLPSLSQGRPLPTPASVNSNSCTFSPDPNDSGQQIVLIIAQLSLPTSSPPSMNADIEQLPSHPTVACGREVNAIHLPPNRFGFIFFKEAQNFRFTGSPFRRFSTESLSCDPLDCCLFPSCF